MRKIRNDAQHKKDENDYTTTKRLRNQVACVFIEADELNLCQERPFSTTCVEDITALPIARQRDWVEINTKLSKRSPEKNKRPSLRKHLTSEHSCSQKHQD